MNLDFRNTNSLWCSVLAETLFRCGVRHAIVSPGSRSTSLVFAFASHPQIEAIPVLDERSAAFFALGLAKQTQRAVALVCTSGTAAANYFPAIIEAQESGTPLIVVTADRPPEMRACSSGQTIDQQKIYGSHVNWYHELAVPEASLERLRYLRQTIAHAFERASWPERGPVHINAPFRDPLPPLENESAVPLRGKIDDAFFAHVSGVPHRKNNTASIPSSGITSRTLIIAGPGAKEAESIADWPILADALADIRHSSTTPDKHVRISSYDAILRNERLARELAPDFVICVGGWPTSKVLRTWIEKTQPEIIMVSCAAQNRDALHGRARHVAEIAQLGALPSCDRSYRDAWTKVEAATRTALDHALAEASRSEPDLFEPCATWLLARHLPERAAVFVANSMPVRDVEYFWPVSNRGYSFFFNRGANGIDGTLSTALGVAHANTRPAVLLTGDLSLLHDTNGFLLANASRFNGSLTIVLINNNGGGIFEHLPVATFNPPFEEYFATPQKADFAKLCAAYGIEHTPIKSWSTFTAAIATLPAKGVRVLEMRTDRKRDTERRKSLLARASA